MPVAPEEFPAAGPIVIHPPFPDDGFLRQMANELLEKAEWKPRRVEQDPLYSTDLACDISLAPAFLVEATRLLFHAGTAYYGLDVNAMDVPFLLRYPAGIGHRPHRDWSPLEVDGSNYRTISMTWMLSDEFAGGTLCSEYGRHPAEFGQAVLFLANTLHWVEPVESGERLVLIAFGKRVDHE